MTTIETLRETRHAVAAHAQKLLNDAKAIIGRADTQQRDLTPAEQRESDRLSREIEARTAEIQRLDNEITEGVAAAEDARAGVSMGRLVPPMPLAGQAARADAPLTGSPKFFAMFPNVRQSSRAEFANFGDFAKAVWERNPRLFQNASGASEGVGADGGFYVPMQYYADLMDSSLQQEAIRPNATIIPMTSASVQVPMFDLSNRSTGIATMEGTLTAEGATGTTQKPKVRTIDMTARKIQVLVPTTLELLNDAPQLFTSLLKQHMADALAQTLDSWFISGNGAGVPLGILNAPCLVSVAKDTNQVAATITPTNLAGMVSRLSAGSWSRAQWLVSPSALAQLFTITTVIKNVAGAENVGGFGPNWFTSNPDGSFTLLGRPLIVSDRCQALGTKGDILLCDMRSYLVGIRQNAELAVDNSIGFKESEVWFRLNCRVDGQPALAAPITPRVGSATLSTFVALDTR